MNNIITIENVRGFIDENGTAMFNAEDVARGWGFTRVAASGNTVVRWERVNSYLQEFGFVPTSGHGVVKDDFLPESIVYRLGFKANNATAQHFQQLLAEVILPELRRTGSYSVKPVLPQDYITALRALADAEEEKLKLVAENKVLAPKAEYTDNVLSSEGYMTVTQIAKDYGRSAKWLNSILQAEGIQYKQSGQWMLYAKFADRGYTVSGTHVVGDNSFVSTYWTQEGRKFIYDMLKEKYNLVPRETGN